MTSSRWCRGAGVAGGGRPEYPGREPMLRLTPARHGTDGFFVAVLERKPALAQEGAAAEDAET